MLEYYHYTSNPLEVPSGFYNVEADDAWNT